MSNDKWMTVFADWKRGQAVTESGMKISFAPGCNLFQLLRSISQEMLIHRVYLCGDLPPEYKTWLICPEMYQAWRTQRIGHMLDGNQADAYVARYEHRASGDRLDIRSIERWVGEQDVSIYDARAALLLLTQYLKPHFPLFRHLAGTPSSTFGALWKQYNALEQRHYPLLPESIRALLRRGGQGRIEYFEEHCQGRIPGLYYYDGIFMYAALTWGLPTEVETHDDRDEYAGKQFGRYLIRFRVPAGWEHIGPFGVWDGEQWLYPGLHHHCQEFETWVDGAEIDALVRFYQALGLNAFEAWQIVIKSRIIYKNPKDSTAKNPLDGVIKRLVKIRERIEADAQQDPTHGRAYALARAAARNLILHGIGAFYRQAGTRTYIGLATDPPPPGFLDRDELDDGRVVYILPDAAHDDMMAHPEWPVCVWARCRARMFLHALAVPYERLIAIRTDAIAVTCPVGDWEANTQIGKLRRKWAIEKPLRAPATAQEFDALQHKILGR